MAMRSYTDRVVLLAMETTYNTPVPPVALDAILTMGTEVQPAADKLERNVDRPFFGGNPFVLVNKRVTLTGTCDIIGAAVPGDPAPLGKLYRICAHNETLDAGVDTTYAPISKNFESGTLDFFWAGIRFRLTGARGYLDFDYTIKNFGRATFNVTGILTVPVDGEAPAGIDWTPFQTPAAIESETWDVVVNGVNVCAQQLTLQQNATVAPIECSNGREIAITARAPGGVLRVYKDSPLATWNPWQLANNHTLVDIENSITKGAGLNVQHNIRAQFEYPRPIELDGMAGFEIPFTAIPTGAGGDEYSIVLT